MTEITPAPIICILGMHRSGTSCLTGSLQQAGLHLGKYHSWNLYNQKGNRENQDIVDFHEQLLRDNQASWDQPPRKLRFGKQDVDTARSLITNYQGEGRWGFKDPRSLLALELWQQAAVELQYVGIFRHPRSVARSLSHRSGGRMTEDDGFKLWLKYNKILYAAYRRQPFPILCFDWEEQKFHDKLDKVIAGLGLQAGTDTQRFYTKDLMTFEGGLWDGVPWRVRRLYRKLADAAMTDGLGQVA